MRHQNSANLVFEPNLAAVRADEPLRSRASAWAQAWSQRSWEPALLLGFAVFAGLYAPITRYPAHQMWAVYAAAGYAAGALVLVARPVRQVLPMLTHRRWLVVGLLVLGTIVVPLGHQAIDGVANPEIAILREAAARWLGVGTPFPTEAELAGRGWDVNAYNVYLPLLAVFGLPSAGFGPSPVTDPRIYLALVSGAILLGLGRRNIWPVALFLSSPWVALQLVSGATDIPVLGFVLLALVLAGRDRFGWAGVAMGIAAGLKALAWPAGVIALILVGARGGWRACTRFAGAAGLVLVAAVGLPVLADPAAFVVNAIKLPLGVLPVRLTAESPLPGHLLSQAGPVGHAIGLALLGGAALSIGIGALRCPPRDAVTAARWIALGMLVAMLLAPATRFGYLVYSIGLLLLPVLAGSQISRPPGHPGSTPRPEAVPAPS